MYSFSVIILNVHTTDIDLLITQYDDCANIFHRFFPGVIKLFLTLSRANLVLCRYDNIISHIIFINVCFSNLFYFFTFLSSCFYFLLWCSRACCALQSFSVFPLLVFNVPRSPTFNFTSSFYDWSIFFRGVGF